jgi:hypothetical protein
MEFIYIIFDSINYFYLVIYILINIKKSLFRNKILLKTSKLNFLIKRISILYFFIIIFQF